MILVRSADPTDLDTLLELARKAGPGMTTFKADRDALAARLERVRLTLADEAPLAQQGYLFVMEDTATGHAVGTAGIETAVGLDQPFYSYRQGLMVHASRELGVWARMPTLYLSHDLTGYSELCTLFLDADYRHNGNGPLLSRSRFMFIAEFLERFPERICAEMRGYFDDNNNSPFWEALGKRFFSMEFEQADMLVSLGKKAFLAELMPKHPVYVAFLPESAQHCIGLTHKDTVPARKLLEGEGLRFENHIDIFEAGPILECHIADLRACRESEIHPVVIDNAPPTTPEGERPPAWLVSNRQLHDFRVVQIPRVPQEDGVHLTAAEAAALHLGAGDTVRTMTLHPKHLPSNPARNPAS
jgi:arginine N-succinyltransferase